MRKIWTIVFMIAMVSIATQAQVEQDDTVAMVNGIPVLVSDMLGEISALSLEQQARINDQAREQILRDIMARKLTVQKAYDLKLDTFSTIKAQIERAKEQILIQNVLNLVIQQNQPKSITEAQLKSYYQQNESLFIQPARVRVSQIVVKDKETAEDILDKLDDGESFAALARQYSITRDAEIGGDAGYLTVEQLNSEIADKIFALGSGEISDILNIKGSYYIVKVTDKVAEQRLEFSEINQEQLKNSIGNQIAQNTEASYKRDLIKNAEISTNNKILYNFTIPIQERLRQQQMQRQAPQTSPTGQK